MFNQNNNEEKKLDWMYKGPNSNVDREEYLLGRPVDKTLEQINDEDKQKQLNLIVTPKNRVEHECIPPSIRDFNKLVQAEQVDLSTKLQEDPLVAIRKREEETRRQFLQNPVQLKKLQKALKAQQAKKKKKKKKKKSKDSSDSDSDLEAKLTEKLLGAKNKKTSKEERDLDTILIHKLEALKDKLTDDDLRDILNGKISDSDDGSEEENDRSKKKTRENSVENEDDRKRKDRKEGRRRENYRCESSEERRNKNYNDLKRRDKRRDHDVYKRTEHDSRNSRSEHRKDSQRRRSRSQDRQRRSNSSESDHHSRSKYSSKKHDSDDSDSQRNKKLNYGLVSSDGKKIPFTRKDSSERKRTPPKSVKAPEPVPHVQRNKAKKLTEEEKEKLRKEMMENAVWRDKERERNVKKYREKEEKERKEQDFDPEFIHKQLLKSANISSVESRIKSNVNNIQRSGRDMDKHFSRR